MQATPMTVNLLVAMFRMDLLSLMGTWALGGQSSFIFSCYLQTWKLPVLGEQAVDCLCFSLQQLLRMAGPTACPPSCPWPLAWDKGH